ncbi:helix-turn-helix transcriptional regulator [Aeromonas media]|uniref:helix-turn-helix transcriptional regulator n=1 Tax=Aeromonas TaxID=642 RepID=UPI0013154E6A|nr:MULTISPECIES: AlpA family phage regulatory protein [Aeromonas]MDM5122012.1 AlpA family phage regulatory protein [Aeromonas rivipollensis]
MSPVLVTEKQVTELASVSRSTIRRWINDPRVNFPAFIKIGPSAIRWKLAEVLTFIERQGGCHE